MPDLTVSVVVTLAQASVSVGGSTQATARITTDVPDGALDPKPVVWSSLTPAVATVDANGLVSGVSAGSTAIRAMVGTVAGSASLSVSLPVIDLGIGAAAIEAALLLLQPGQRAVLRGPTTDIDVQMG